MKVLVINSGSSSIKYQLINMKDESVLAKGLVERIGMDGSVLIHEKTGDEKVKISQPMKDHTAGIELVLKMLADEKHGVVSSMEEIEAVGHRIVHGGDYIKSVYVTDKVIQDLLNSKDLAPLHTPANVMGIQACKALMPDTPMVTVFDTAFHQTMPPHTYMYSLPYECYEKHKVRKYGFHGTSHRYVTERAAHMLRKDVSQVNLVSCHLGNGSSICMIKNGKSMDTTMGFTPLAGLTMGTRCGNIDPAIIKYLMDKENWTIDEIDEVLNKKSGVLGISGISSDFRDVEEAAKGGNQRAQLALDIFIQRVRSYIGAYVAELNGPDAIIFTAGIGENGIELRERICENMDFIGIQLDPERNHIRGKETYINTLTSKIRILVIPTNEELMIARDTEEIVKTLRVNIVGP